MHQSADNLIEFSLLVNYSATPGKKLLISKNRTQQVGNSNKLLLFFF